MGPTTYRRMLLWRLDASAERCRQTGALSGLGRLLGDLAAVLTDRWPKAEPMPLYPAFRPASDSG